MPARHLCFQIYFLDKYLGALPTMFSVSGWEPLCEYLNMDRFKLTPKRIEVDEWVHSPW